MNDLISIIIPMYNAEKYLTETLDSVLNQSYENWECLIIDDGSTDKSQECANKYCNADKRFKYYYQNNYGPSVARNFGITKSQGKYIQFLDSDDVMLPNMIQLLLNESKKVDDNVIVYSGFLLGDSDNIQITTIANKKTSLGKDLTFKEMYSNFGLNVTFIPGCILFPSKCFANIVWNEKLNHSEDWELYLQITSMGYVFRNIKQNLLLYRNTPNSLSKQIIETIKSNYIILDKWKLGFTFQFINRCSLLLKKNIIYFATKNTNSILNPIKYVNKRSFINYMLFLFVIILAIICLLIELTQILFKKITK